MLFRAHLPIPPSRPRMSWRDVGLLDLARHAIMGAALPLDHVEPEGEALFAELRARADAMGPDATNDDVFDALEPLAHDIARDRAVHLAA